MLLFQILLLNHAVIVCQMGLRSKLGGCAPTSWLILFLFIRKKDWNTEYFHFPNQIGNLIQIDPKPVFDAYCIM